MLEKETSGVPQDLNQSPQSAGAAPGGPFPQGQPPPDAMLNPSGPPQHNPLHYLLAAMKKLSK